MGTQKEIAKKIVSNEADYILSVKEYHKILYCDIKLYLDDIVTDKDVIKSSSYYKTVEKGHGRIEMRICVTSEGIGWLTGKDEWKNIIGIGAIYCTIEENEKNPIKAITLFTAVRSCLPNK